MYYVTSNINRNVKTFPVQPLVVPAATNTQIVASDFAKGYDVQFIDLYNNGVNDLYLNYGNPADNDKNWSFVLVKGAMYTLRMRDVPLYGYSVGGRTIGFTVGVRDGL